MSAAALLQLVLAYLLGSIPSAYVAGRWLKGIDIRRHGSGNMGATNVFRVMGRGPGAAVLVADILKGFVAVLWLPRLGAPGEMTAFFSNAMEAKSWWPCVLGLAAVLGHTYTLFLGFKGGKGVATSLGVFLGLAPLATLSVLLLFGMVFWVSRMVSAGSLAGAAALPSLVASFHELKPMAHRPVPGGLLEGLLGRAPVGWGLEARPVFWLALLLSTLVWVRHLPNIRRILNGTESRFQGKGSGEGAK